MFPFRYVHGCLQSCSDADACNTASKTLHISSSTYVRIKYLLIFLVVIFINNYQLDTR